jgi:hypothetical protein
MVNYESLEGLYSFLEVPNLPRMHWSDNSAWLMAEFMFAEVTAAIRSRIKPAPYISISSDETTSCDNGSWISVHAYVCENWTRMPYLVSLQKVSESPSADHLTSMILQAPEDGGGVGTNDIAEKLLYFGTDGITMF